MTTKSPSPSIVITNERRQRIDQLSIGILSQNSLEICEIQVYIARSNLSPDPILVFNLCMFVWGFYLMATNDIIDDIDDIIESANAQGG